MGDFVDEGFEGKYVAMRAERAQRRGADWHRQQAMVGDGPGGKVVERHGIALRAAAADEGRVDRDQRRERFLQMGGGEQRRGLGAARACAVAIAGDVVFPIHDVAVGVESGFEVHGHRRAERCPSQLLRARPLQAHRAARYGAREQRRVVGDVVCAIVAVAAGAFGVMHDDG